MTRDEKHWEMFYLILDLSILLGVIGVLVVSLLYRKNLEGGLRFPVLWGLGWMIKGETVGACLRFHQKLTLIIAAASLGYGFWKFIFSPTKEETAWGLLIMLSSLALAFFGFHIFAMIALAFGIFVVYFFFYKLFLLISGGLED